MHPRHTWHSPRPLSQAERIELADKDLYHLETKLAKAKHEVGRIERALATAHETFRKLVLEDQRICPKT